MKAGSGSGSREANRNRTRRALRSAALTLFDRDGYEATSIAAIAELAGVSERTFFRYFASKEDVAFPGVDPSLDQIRAALTEMPAGMSAWDSLVAAFITVAERQGPPELDDLRRHQRVLRRTPILAGHQSMGRREWERAMTAALASHLCKPADDPGLAALVAAAVAIAFVATDEWIAGSTTTLAQQLRTDFGAVAAALRD